MLMPLPFWPEPPAFAADALHPVVDDQRAVLALLRCPHLDAVVADVMHMIAGNFEALGIQREEAGLLLQQKRIARDAPAAIPEHQAIAAAFKGETADAEMLCAIDTQNVPIAQSHQPGLSTDTFNLQ